MEWLSEFGAIAAMQGFNGLSVFCVLLLKAAGWNILRASDALAQQARKPRKQGNRPPQGLLGLIRFAFRTFLAALANPLPAWPCHFSYPPDSP